MSVFKRNSSPYYSYDFRLRGIRLSGPTYCQTRSDAERFEAAKKREVRERADAFRNPDLPFSLAAERFYQEVGQFRSAPDNTFRSLAWLGAALGNRTPLRSITNSTVAELVAKRRDEGVSPSTVNRSVVEPLRNIMRRAETVWELQVPRIDWKRHRLKEPQERVREASTAEEEKLLALVPVDYRPAIQFALLTGCRRGEIVGLTWPKVSFEAREFRITGKGDRSRTIPMTWEVVALLRTLESHHETSVFTFEAQRTRDGRTKGQRYPITANGIQTMWNRYVRGKMDNFRFHDTRHTAATRLVRATGNLKLAQRLLGHAEVTTTSRYAHVNHEDLRAGLEAAGKLPRG